MREQQAEAETQTEAEAEAEAVAGEAGQVTESWIKIMSLPYFFKCARQKWLSATHSSQLAPDDDDGAVLVKPEAKVAVESGQNAEMSWSCKVQKLLQRYYITTLSWKKKKKTLQRYQYLEHWRKTDEYKFIYNKKI